MEKMRKKSEIVKEEAPDEDGDEEERGAKRDKCFMRKSGKAMIMCKTENESEKERVRKTERNSERERAGS